MNSDWVKRLCCVCVLARGRYCKGVHSHMCGTLQSQDTNGGGTMNAEKAADEGMVVEGPGDLGAGAGGVGDASAHPLASGDVDMCKDKGNTLLAAI